jgi:outer membrane cobalamin receptor
MKGFNGRTGMSGLVFILIFTTCVMRVQAQDFEPLPDTLRNITLDEVVITANRFENKIMNTGSTIDVMRMTEMATFPATTFSNTLKYIPGIYQASTDGMGMSPQISIRGFYGGGEAEYLTVLVDGMAVNDVTNGMVSWNILPLNQMKRIELLRGGSSALYGDAAMGGVMNIITENAGIPYTNASINYGSFNSYGIGVNHGGNLGKAKYELYANNDHTDGFRTHSKWNSVAFGAKLKFPLGNNSSLTLNSNNQLLQSEEPGPMSEVEMSEDREQSLPYFRDDGLDQERYLASADFKSEINNNTDIGIGITYRHSKKDDTRTYTQSTPVVDPFTFQPIGVYDTTLYGDTKQRSLTTNQAGLNFRLYNANEDIGLKIIGGIEANYSNFSSKYYDVFNGFQNDYQNHYLPVDTLGAYGDGYRFNTAVYASGEIRLLDPLKLIVGLRYDLIVDDFNSKIPDTSYSENNSAFSPKIAFNVSTGETENYSGSIYLSFSRSFKVPTIDQRTDLKRLNYAIFFPAGPTYQMVIYQANPFANPGLKPQKSNNLELGTYQYFKLTPNLSGEINLAGYYIKVKDEIDFDLTTLQYGNIQDSEHTGLETGIRLMYKNALSGFINVNYNEVKFLSGEYEGNYLKGIPKTSYVIGAGYSPEKGIGGTLALNGSGSIFLDDENTETLSSYSILSARIDYKLNFVTIYVDVENIFNTKYSTTGYFLNNQKYLFPAVGTMFRGGLNFSF